MKRRHFEGILLLGFFTLLFLLASASPYLKLSPPASVLVTAFQMPYQYTVKYLVVVLFAMLVLYSGIHLFKRRRPTVAGVVFSVAGVLIIALGVVYQLRIFTAPVQASGLVYQRTVLHAGQYQTTTKNLATEAQMAQCMVTVPESSPNAGSCIIHLNYGGWQVQAPDMGDWLKQYASSRGFSYVQLAGAAGGNNTILDMVNDAKKGIRYVQQTYGFDHIYLCGGSAGGTVAMLCGFSGGQTADTNGMGVDGVIALYPISDPAHAYVYYVQQNTAHNLLDALGDRLYCTLLGGTGGTLAGETKRMMDGVFGVYGAPGNLYAKADPLTLATKTQVPLLLVQGSADAMAPPQDTKALYEALSAEGKPVAYLALPGVGHAFDLVAGTAQNDRVVAELDNWLAAAGQYEAA